MTAVIGMLNKKGVAIAADSAVTRTRGGDQKVTKNGNKMVRVSDVIPVSVMITGNALFIRNPWDIIVRKYRQERGNIYHSSVEDSMRDLLDYISLNDAFWNSGNEEQLLKSMVESFMDKLNWNIDFEAKKTDDQGNIKRPKLFVKETLKTLKSAQKFYASKNEGAEKYDFEKFQSLISPIVNSYLNDTEDEPFDSEILKSFKDYFNEIREDLLKALYGYLTYTKGDASATLIFTGYGKNDLYPSLVAIDINEGFDHHINWEITQKVNIDDNTPAAICPFAQTDVITSLLTGASFKWLNSMDREFETLYNPSVFLNYPIEDHFENPEMSELNSIISQNLSMRRRKMINKMRDENKAAWVKDLEEYDIKSMAELALTLVDLTGLQRILTFQQEGVGGDIDIAVITKTDGFTWLNRKSWYHHKDIGGRYGSMGV